MKNFLGSNSQTRRINFAVSMAVFLGLISLAAVLLRLPLKDIASRMIYHIDAYLVSWIWSWEAHILSLHPGQLFTANIFAPFQHTLAFSETMLGSFLLAWPVLLISGGNAALTYNVVMLLTYGIAGLGMYQLVLYYTRNKSAAIIAAVIYALAPFKLVQNGHLHLSGMWLPYVFLYLDKFFKRFSWPDGLKLALFVILVLLTSLHYVIFLPLAGLIFLLIKAREIKFNRENIIKIVALAAGVSLIALPIITPYLQVHQQYGQFRGTEVNKEYAPTVLDYFVSPLLYNNMYKHRQHIEMVVSPGWLVWLIFILAIGWLWRKRRELRRQTKKQLAFYLSMGGLACLISFGFYWRLAPEAQNYWPGLFAFFYGYWPGFSSIRASGRYSVFVLLSLAVISGIAINFWQNKYRWLKQYKLSFSLGIIFLLLIEFSLTPNLGYARVKLDKNELALTNWLKQQPNNKIFLELPMGVNKNKINYDVYYVFASRYHFKKIVNGYSGYYPPGYLQLVKSSRFFNVRQIIPWLKKFKVNYLIFHWARYQPAEKLRLMQNLRQSGKIKYIINFGENYVYQIINNQ